ncbi:MULTISPECIES: TIGR01777 family oxidoreductase [unclassified Exiguobacterium]|uniref:TIGR01777 family oxidoreductase n=1 Tax=unclassified Exiguobacterium TaxID=2644629 RepID=UPI001BE9E8A9|nr:MULTISPECIES: TIGR01777 family oxidoreductase [unclassified Exiguobacterium]
MKIAITGGTGMIGQALSKRLIAEGHHVYILTRSVQDNTEHTTYVEWLTSSAAPEQQLEGIDAFIHLAGASINDGRWTEERKQTILQSRIDSTKELVRINQALTTKPAVVLSASAVGIYGQDRHQTFTEEQPLPPTSDFLSQVCVKWEALAQPIADLGIRLVHPRIGVVLSKEGGAYPLMRLPYKLFGGGTMGDGKQWVSWVHIDDLVELFIFALKTNQLTGPLNITAPHPETMRQFGKTIGKTLHRPHWLPAPRFALELALGEKSVIVLEGARVIPKKALENGFKFRYAELKDALSNLEQTN